MRISDWSSDVCSSDLITLRVRRPAAAPLRVAASRSHLDERTQAALARMGDIERFGLGSSLTFVRIEQGRADVYPRFGPTSEWDTAAAQGVLEAAGGVVLALDGESLRSNRQTDMLISARSAERPVGNKGGSTFRYR